MIKWIKRWFNLQDSISIRINKLESQKAELKAALNKRVWLEAEYIVVMEATNIVLNPSDPDHIRYVEMYKKSLHENKYDN